jgi:2-polyprenyl-3-methyl-5-hydroxy-6-metoxy-1,4-benzoquinol methylase
MTLAAEYNDWHQKVSDASPEGHDANSPWYKLVGEYLPSVEDRRVLEMACGRGGFSRLLAARGARMFGADFSSTALQIARGKSAGAESQPGVRLELAQADAQNLPYATSSFDIIVSCETIEHLPDPAAALREMARVARPGARLFLTTPNYFNLMGLYYIYARARNRRATPGADQPFDRVFLFPQIRALLRNAGWRIVRSDGTVHQFPIRPGHDPIIVESLEANRALRRILSPFAFHYFVLGENAKAD